MSDATAKRWGRPPTTMPPEVLAAGNPYTWNDILLLHDRQLVSRQTLVELMDAVFERTGDIADFMAVDHFRQIIRQPMNVNREFDLRAVLAERAAPHPAGEQAIEKLAVLMSAAVFLKYPDDAAKVAEAMDFIYTDFPSMTELAQFSKTFSPYSEAMGVRNFVSFLSAKNSKLAPLLGC